VIDAVLYRHTKRGRLVLEEVECKTIRDLALYVLRHRRQWEWAEVVLKASDGATARYSIADFVALARGDPVQCASPPSALCTPKFIKNVIKQILSKLRIATKEPITHDSGLFGKSDALPRRSP
jgi:hypothetical protein